MFLNWGPTLADFQGAKKSCNFGATLFTRLMQPGHLQNQALAFTSTSTRNIRMDHLGLASNNSLAGHVYLGLVLRWFFFTGFYHGINRHSSPTILGDYLFISSTHLKPNPRFVSMKKKNEPTNSQHPTPPQAATCPALFFPQEPSTCLWEVVFCALAFFSKKNKKTWYTLVDWRGLAGKWNKFVRCTVFPIENVDISTSHVSLQ